MAQRSASGEAAAFKGAEKSDDARTLGEPVSESIEVDLRLCPLDDADSECQFAYIERSREAEDA